MPRRREEQSQWAEGTSRSRPNDAIRYPTPISNEQEALQNAFRMHALPRKRTERSVMRDEPQDEQQNESQDDTEEDFDTDDMGADTEMLNYAADAQLKTEAAHRPTQSASKAAGGNRLTRTTTEALKATLMAYNKKDKDSETVPWPLGPPKPQSQRPKTYSIDPYSVSMAPSGHLTPQERKDLKLDQHVRQQISSLRDQTWEFCTKFFRGSVYLDDEDDEDPDTQEWIRNLPWETVSYAGCVAEGGPGAEKGWKNLVRSTVYRQALVYAMIQRALKEHVFGSLLFGAPQDLYNNLVQMEQKQEDKDGFYRAEARAQAISSHELHHRTKIVRSPEQGEAVLRMALQIEALLRPIFLLLESRTPVKYDELTQSLIRIVATAAELATEMRVNGGDVLYHFLPVFKDEPIDTVKMEILNYDEMREEATRQAEDDYGSPLVRIVCAFQLAAYRKGGGVMAERILEKEENEIDLSVAPEMRHLPRNQDRGRIITAKDGFRCKVIAKAVVAGRLGTPRQMGGDEDDAGNKYRDLMDIIDRDPSKRCGVM